MTLSRYDHWKLDTPSNYDEECTGECQRCGEDADDDDLCGPCVEAVDLLAADDDWSDLFGVDMLGAGTHLGGGR